MVTARVLRAAAGLVLLAGSAVASTQASERPPADGDIVWGVNGHPLVSYPGISLEEQIDHAAELGATSYRVDVSKESHADPLAELIAEAAKRGIEILPVLIPPVDLATEPPEAIYEKSFSFAAKFVARFKDRISVWELGNEMENFAILQPCEMQDDGVQYNCEYGPASGVTKLEYHGGRWKKVSSALKGMSDAVKSVSPDARKAIGTAGWGHVGAFARMKDDGIDWDISVWHDYSGKFDWGLEKVAKFGKPIWITEFNADSGSQKGLEKQAEGLSASIRTLREIASKYAIEAAHIYELVDETYWAPDFEAYMGLLHLEKPDGKDWRVTGPKPAFCAARTLLRGGWRQPAPDGARHPTGKVGLSEAIPRRSCDLCAYPSRGATTRQAISYSYCLALGHAPDGGGLNAWTRDVTAGKAKLGDIRRQMVRLHMREYLRDAAFSDASYLAYLYRLLLDRQPAGQDFWQRVRDLETKAATRESVIDDIMATAQFRWMHPTLYHVADQSRESGKAN